MNSKHQYIWDDSDKSDNSPLMPPCPDTSFIGRSHSFSGPPIHKSNAPIPSLGHQKFYSHGPTPDAYGNTGTHSLIRNELFIDAYMQGSSGEDLDSLLKEMKTLRKVNAALENTVMKLERDSETFKTKYEVTK
jgi:hypothetical protein